ncbi:MAG TPA: alpha/beta hydrolase [Terriglobales bacterium]|jgi:predicted alpha/beta hydrolase family esterase|nr:alpha/beta hydrolase [Terriglobales bacterium]
MVLTVPGLWSSGPEHWQTYWERVLPACRRVEQKEWETPHCAAWIATLDAAVTATRPPVALAAHSLGCVAVAHWANKYGRAVAGALLVAPTDVEGPKFPPGAEGFQPMPLERLPFPSMVVASEDDPWVSLERARFFAERWGSRFVNLGRVGHINSDSKLGEWPQGQELMRELLAGNEGIGDRG